MNALEQTLHEAKQTILQLRRTNEILSAKVEVMNLFATVLHTQPAYNSQSMSPDVCWEIDNRLKELANFSTKDMPKDEELHQVL